MSARYGLHYGLTDKSHIMDLTLIAKKLKLLLSDTKIRSVSDLDVLSDTANVKTSLDNEIDSFLQKSLPEVWCGAVISEEREIDPSKLTDYFWLIDPVDGTINAISGSTDWAISVALIQASSMEPIIGVVYLPLRDEYYAAISGQGASYNDRPLLSSGTSARKHSGYSTPIVSFGVPSDIPAVSEKMGDVLASIMEHGWVTRQTGSAAVDICRVALGSWNAFFEYGLMYWDIAAAILIAREAGCHVTMKADAHEADPPSPSIPRNVLVARPKSFASQLRKLLSL